MLEYNPSTLISGVTIPKGGLIVSTKASEHAYREAYIAAIHPQSIVITGKEVWFQDFKAAIAEFLFTHGHFFPLQAMGGAHPGSFYIHYKQSVDQFGVTFQARLLLFFTNLAGPTRNQEIILENAPELDGVLMWLGVKSSYTYTFPNFND